MFDGGISIPSNGNAFNRSGGIAVVRQDNVKRRGGSRNFKRLSPDPPAERSPREGPSIILCVKKWSLLGRGSSQRGEGQNRRVRLIKPERRGYKKILGVEFEDICKTDLQNSFQSNRARIRGV